MFKKIIPVVILAFFALIILALSLRGLMGNPSAKELSSTKWQEQGPFELSPERGRFALMYSLVENRSFQFSKELALFAQPDVVVTKDKFASMFAPLVSFVIAPGYLIGKHFGASQAGSFATISLFAVLNLLLIRSIAIKLGAKPLAATLGSLTFLFATPAFSYGVNLYQHHISTFLILTSIWAILRFNNFLSLLIVFFLSALSIPLDYPNLFFMFPIGVYILNRIIKVHKEKFKVLININITRLLTSLIVIFPILFFLWFNQASYGNPFQLSGTLPSASDVLKADLVAKQASTSAQAILQKEFRKEKTAFGFFESRRLLNGFYIHLFSPDRGLIYFTPVMLFAVLGAVFAYKRRVKLVSLFLAIILANVLLYSMWKDPWGGWAFGSRYLIPSYALMAVFIALALTTWRKKLIVLTIFLSLFGYSVSVNTLGALTSNANPPQVEVLHLEELSGKEQKYTYERNWDFLKLNSKSFIYQSFAKNYLTPVQYYQLILCFILSFSLITTFLLYFGERKKND